MFSEAAESIANDSWFHDRRFSGLLHELLSQLVAALSVRRAYIAAASPGDYVRLVAAWQDGAPAATEDYAIANTPCAEALASGTHTVINSDGDLFPQLRVFGTEPTRGYTSHPIVNSAGAVIGHICLLSNSPIREGIDTRTTLSLVADRIAAEIEHETRNRESSSHIRDTHALLANLPGMVYRCRNDRARPMQYVSNGCIELSGYRPEALIGGHPCWRDIIHPDDREAAWASVQQALKRNENFETQYRIETSDGHVKWVLDRGCAVVPDDSGMLVEGFISDITPLRSKDLELQHAEALASSIVESIADGILLADIDGRIRLMNQAATKMFSSRVPRGGDRSVCEFLEESECAIIEAEVRQFVESGESTLFTSGLEMTGVQSDQTTFPIHVRAQQMSIDSGSCYLASIRDISEQKARQARILQQNERMKATIEFSPMGIITFGRDLRIVAANSAFADMIGFAPDDIVGRQLSAFTHPDEVANTTEAALSSFTKNVNHFSIRTRYSHKDGHVVHAALHVALGYDATGSPNFGVANIEDLTANLSAAALIKDQQNELARIDRLSSLGEIASGIAHEINQPLAAMSTYAQAAVRFLDQGNAGSERLREALLKLSEQTFRASAIVEKIRTLSRQRKPQTERVDCSELVRRTVELLENDSENSDIRIHMELAQNLPVVLCDPIQVQQAVLYLVRNAIESMQRADFRGGKDLILKTEATDEGDVRISVVDAGQGVDDSVSDTLFLPFSTCASTGLGMGLSTASSIVKAFGGGIEYRNNAFGGATFAITLPGHLGENSA